MGVLVVLGRLRFRRDFGDLHGFGWIEVQKRFW